MDNKLTKDKLRKLNTYTSLNRPYIPDYNQPDKSEIYSTFTNSDYNTIIQKINDTNILNFRNEDGTNLIHAIIQNTSITEDKKINIIKELIKKNLTINILNKYNESPLHYAAKNGNYYVFEFLLKNNADYTIIDNNGNRKSIKNHRLVALNFIPNPENKETVNHINQLFIDSFYHK